MISDDDIDRAIRETLHSVASGIHKYNIGPPTALPVTEFDRAIYRAGYTAGLEAAAKLAEDRKGAWYKIWNDRGNVSISDATAAAIRELKD